MDNNPGDDDSGKHTRPGIVRDPTPDPSTRHLTSSRNNNSETTPARSRSRTSLPSFSELMRSLASRSPRSNPQLPSTMSTLQTSDGGLRLTPVFNEHQPIQSPTRVNFLSSSSSPTRAGPSTESTGNWAPRQQGNNALAPGLTTGTSSLDTRVDSRNNIPSLTTRGSAQYRIPGFQQQPTATPSERIAGSQSRNFQFYLADRTAPRTYRACTHCRARKVKCETDPSRDRCRRCIERGLRCSEAIPISPLVGSLLSSEKDAVPLSRKRRSESDPVLPRDHPSRSAAETGAKPQLGELFMDPETGEFRVPSILQPANSTSSIATATNRQTQSVDLSKQSLSREKRRHTLSSEYRSSHRHDPVGGSERRNRLSKKAREDKVVGHPSPSSVQTSGDVWDKLTTGSKHGQNRPRAFSNPPLRPIPFISPKRLPPQSSDSHASMAETSGQTPQRVSPPISTPPISPVPTQDKKSSPHASPLVTTAQSFVRTHRRHVASIQELLSPVEGPHSSTPNTPETSGTQTTLNLESRRVITVIRLVPEESAPTEEGGDIESSESQATSSKVQTDDGAPIQIDPEEDHTK